MTVKKTIARVIINNNKATAVDKEYSYAREARKVAKASFDNTKIVVGNATAKTWSGAGNLEKLFGASIKDQYGAPSNTAPYITFTDFSDKDGVTVTNNGTTTASVKITKNVTLTIKLAFPGSNYVFEKVVTLKVS